MLKEVRHIPYLKKNLISASKLDGKGYVVSFRNKIWKVAKGSIVVARGELISSLYLFSNSSNDVVNLAPTNGKNANKGHQKFGDKREVGFGEKNKVGKGVSKVR